MSYLNSSSPRIILPALERSGPLNDLLSAVEESLKSHLPLVGDEDWLGVRLAVALQVHLLGQEWILGFCATRPTFSNADAQRISEAYIAVGLAMAELGREVRVESIQTGNSVNRILRRKARKADRPRGDPALPADMLRLLRVIQRYRVAKELAIDDVLFLLVPGAETRLVHKERHWKAYCKMMLNISKKRTVHDDEPRLPLMLSLRLWWMNRHLQRISTRNPRAMGDFGGFETGSLALRRTVTFLAIVATAILFWLIILTSGGEFRGGREERMPDHLGFSP